jgi:hypothetical protein
MLVQTKMNTIATIRFHMLNPLQKTAHPFSHCEESATTKAISVMSLWTQKDYFASLAMTVSRFVIFMVAARY